MTSRPGCAGRARQRSARAGPARCNAL